MALWVYVATFDVLGVSRPDYAWIKRAFEASGVRGGGWIGDPRVTRQRKPGAAGLAGATTVTAVGIYGWPAGGPWAAGAPLHGEGSPSWRVGTALRQRLSGLAIGGNATVRGMAYDPARNGPLDWWRTGRAARNLERDAVRDWGTGDGDHQAENPLGVSASSRLEETATETLTRGVASAANAASAAGERAREAASSAAASVREAAGEAAAAASQGLGEVAKIALVLGGLYLVSQLGGGKRRR